MMYSFSITEQLVVFIESVGFGVLLAISYGIIDIITSLFTVGKKKTVICDIVFCLVCAVSLFGFILAYNLGKIRLYMILGISLGLIAYFTAFGAYVQRIGEIIIGFVHKVFRLILSPVRRLTAWLTNTLKRTANKIKDKHNRPKNEKKKIKKLHKAIAKEKESVV